MKDLSQWIVHLKEPLILMGFVAMLFTGIITVLIKKGMIRLSQKGTDKLLSNSILYAFIIAFTTTALGLYQSISSKERPANQAVPVNVQPRVNETQHQIPQQNIQSPHDIKAGGDVMINYGDGDKKKK